MVPKRILYFHTTCTTHTHTSRAKRNHLFEVFSRLCLCGWFYSKHIAKCINVYKVHPEHDQAQRPTTVEWHNIDIFSIICFDYMCYCFCISNWFADYGTSPVGALCHITFHMLQIDVNIHVQCMCAKSTVYSLHKKHTQTRFFVIEFSRIRVVTWELCARIQCTYEIVCSMRLQTWKLRTMAQKKKKRQNANQRKKSWYFRLPSTSS